MNEKKKIVERFIKTIYPEMTELAMSVNTEETCLRDAIELINELRADRDHWKNLWDIAVHDGIHWKARMEQAETFMREVSDSIERYRFGDRALEDEG